MSGPPRAARVRIGADGRPANRDAALVGQLAAYQDTVVRSGLLDATTTELVRLRCARQHDCRICQTLRLADAVEAGVGAAMTDKIDSYERSDLDERHKVALRLTDAMIWRPTEVSDDLVRQAHEHFTDAELAELLLDITKWSTQKIHVALGTDSADALPRDAAGMAYLRFDDEGRAVTSVEVRP